jgi:hypothetical protein
LIGSEAAWKTMHAQVAHVAHQILQEFRPVPVAYTNIEVVYKQTFGGVAEPPEGASNPTLITSGAPKSLPNPRKSGGQIQLGSRTFSVPCCCRTLGRGQGAFYHAFVLLATNGEL